MEKLRKRWWRTRAGSGATFSFSSSFVELKTSLPTGQWWLIPLIPALGDRDRWSSEFEDNLVYRATSRTARVYRETLSLRKTNKQKQRQKSTKLICLRFSNCINIKIAHKTINGLTSIQLSRLTLLLAFKDTQATNYSRLYSYLKCQVLLNGSIFLHSNDST